MNRYDELRARQQETFNNLPLGYAYSQEQLNEVMRKWDLCHGLDGKPTENDYKQIMRLTTGTFLKKVDRELFHETMARLDKEMEEAIASDTTGDGFIYEMFLSELNNHEFGYTRDTEDTLDALGYTAEEVVNNPALNHGIAKAMFTRAEV